MLAVERHQEISSGKQVVAGMLGSMVVGGVARVDERSMGSRVHPITDVPRRRSGALEPHLGHEEASGVAGVSSQHLGRHGLCDWGSTDVPGADEDHGPHLA